MVLVTGNGPSGLINLAPGVLRPAELAATMHEALSYSVYVALSVATGGILIR